MVFPFIQNSKNANYSDRKPIGGVLQRGGGGRDYKGAQGNFGNDENAHFLDCGDGFAGIHMSKLIRLYT